MIKFAHASDKFILLETSPVECNGEAIFSRPPCRIWPSYFCLIWHESTPNSLSAVNPFLTRFLTFATLGITVSHNTWHGDTGCLRTE